MACQQCWKAKSWMQATNKSAEDQRLLLVAGMINGTLVKLREQPLRGRKGHQRATSPAGT